MFTKLLVSGSALLLLLATATRVQAEALQPEPISSQVYSASHPLLHEYAATDAVPILQLGSTGSAVEDVQQFLSQTGFYEGAIDGKFGTESKAAVKQFQKQNNLVADGVVGYQTWSAMIAS